MSEAKDIFYSRAEESHIQYEETKALIEQARSGQIILGIDNQEAEETLKALENDQLVYSNDILIDYVLSYVSKSTKDEKLLEILNDIKVNNIAKDPNIKGRAYSQYSDGSYYIEIGRDIDKRIRILSDLFATDFMYGENLDFIELLTLIKFEDANLLRFTNNEETNSSYNEAQLWGIMCDRIFKKGFSDKYIALSREIQEMAMAFLVGHEIGHHYYGHTAYSGKSKECNQHIKEIYADIFGIDFAFEYLNSAYPDNDSIHGINQFAGIYVPLAVSAKLCSNITIDSESHPSIIKRIYCVNTILQKKIDENAFQTLQRMFLGLCQKIKLNLNCYLE